LSIQKSIQKTPILFDLNGLVRFPVSSENLFWNEYFVVSFFSEIVFNKVWNAGAVLMTPALKKSDLTYSKEYLPVPHSFESLLFLFRLTKLGFKSNLLSIPSKPSSGNRFCKLQ
jgi:hypothetical protein